MDAYQIIGLMSGTSLDGLDIAHCEFRFVDQKWHYSITCAETVAYPAELEERLKSSTLLSGLQLSLLHTDLGIYFGQQTRQFLDKNKLKADFVSSHGHTVFHQPKESLTLQIGSPAHIAAKCNLPVVADFRTGDVALGGNGAPLVPIGDELLFNEFDVCLNLGGIANFSYRANGKRLAYDVCPFNLIFNYLSNQLGVKYDDGGSLTRTGTVNENLLKQLNALDFYRQIGPKSLGWEWVESEVIPLFEQNRDLVENQLATFCQHVCQQLEKAFPENTQNILITGGGAYHRFFIEQLGLRLPNLRLVIPDDEIIQYKEALIFAFLGVLRWRNQINCLSSVTGASTDSIAGAIYLS